MMTCITNKNKNMVLILASESGTDSEDEKDFSNLTSTATNPLSEFSALNTTRVSAFRRALL